MENILSKMNRVGLKLLTPHTPQETYKTIVQEATKLLSVKYGYILLLEGGELKRTYAKLPASLDRITHRKKSVAQFIFRTQKPLVVTAKKYRKIHPEFRRAGIQSIITIPLSYKHESIGVLSLPSQKEEHFTNNEFKILKLFGSLATLAIQKIRLYDEIKKALEIRDLFISLAAHELRTPLTTISGYIQLLYHKLGEKDSQEGKWVKELSWENMRLVQLVNELLEINRIKTGQLQYIFRVCNISEVANRALSAFRFSHKDRVVVLNDMLSKGKNAPQVIGDFDKLLQAFNNLLDNAASFSPKNTAIRLTLSAIKKGVKIVIEDKGKGIRKENLSRVFEDFYKEKISPEDGFGLGLFLTKHIVKQHKGTIDIKSEESKGTKVEITLPIQKSLVPTL